MAGCVWCLVLCQYLLKREETGWLEPVSPIKRLVKSALFQSPSQDAAGGGQPCGQDRQPPQKGEEKYCVKQLSNIIFLKMVINRRRKNII